MASNPVMDGHRTQHKSNPEGQFGDGWGIGIVSDSPPKSKPQPRPPVVDTDILRDTGIGRKLSFSSDEGDNETVDPGTEEKKLCEVLGDNCNIQGGKKRRRKSRKKRKKKKRRKTRRKRRKHKKRRKSRKRVYKHTGGAKCKCCDCCNKRKTKRKN